MKLKKKFTSIVNIQQEYNGLNDELYGEERFKFRNTTEFYKKAKTSPDTFFSEL